MSKEVSSVGEEPVRKDYVDPPPAPMFDMGELKLWSYYRALIAEFIATMLFLYITVATVIGYKNQTFGDPCGGVGVLGIAWAFGGMIFVLVYCTAGISGGHINPAVTFGLFLARKVSLIRAVAYMVAQCLGAICGVGLVKAFMKTPFNRQGGGSNLVAPGYNKGTALGAEIIGTFVLVYTVFSATDPKRNARDSHVPVLAPLPIGFAVFMVHLATIPITGTGINPARSLGSAVIYNNEKVWDDHLDVVDKHLKSLRDIVLQNCRKMSTEEKKALMTVRTQLSPGDLNKALLIVAQSNPNFQATGQEVDLDIDAQSEATLWKLKFFVKDILQAQGKSPRSIGGSNNTINNNVNQNILYCLV